MKNYVSGMKFKTLLFLLVAGIMFSYVSRKPGLTGKWIICNPDGSPSGEYIDFYKEGTYDITLPGGQIGERGFYTLKDSVFSIRNAKDVLREELLGILWFDISWK